MYQNLLKQSSLYGALRGFDEIVAAEVRERGCQAETGKRGGPCKGKLHRADYPRKPRGATPEVERDPVYRKRLSFCCAKEGCRRRSTPPSALFLGRKVYLGAVVVLVSVLRQGPSPTRLSRLRELVGVSAETVRRWRKWWLSSFAESAFWRAARGLVPQPVNESQLPGSLLAVFEGTGREQLEALLRFIRPLTSRSVPF